MSEKRDSNPRPSPWQGDVLPTELLSQFVNYIVLAGAEGWTRTNIPGFSDQCRDHLGYFGAKYLYFNRLIFKIRSHSLTKTKLNKIHRTNTIDGKKGAPTHLLNQMYPE